MAAGGAAALLLYLWFVSLDFASISGPGDSVVGQAYATLSVLALLWGLLIALVAIDSFLGGPSWPRPRRLPSWCRSPAWPPSSPPITPAIACARST